MIRIAFIIDNEHYFGGVNYVRNLLSAIQFVGDTSIEPYVFCGMKVSDSFVEQFKCLSRVVQSSYFDSQSFNWHKYTKIFEYTGLLYSINKLLNKHKIDILSHSNIYGERLPYKTIHWLPDFQFLKLPTMFLSRDKRKENQRFTKAIQLSNRLIVSSYDARNDLDKYYPGHLEKARVLQFVAQPDPKIYDMTRQQELTLKQKYNASDKYFYIPNQFWKHKNHMVVFEAVNILKSNGLNVRVLCSGELRDFRRNHKKYIEEIYNYLVVNDLMSHISLLGVIPYQAVTYFIRNCVSVINPSFFEGWNTGVEEAKSIGKKVILSNLNVHFEQNPPGASYFDPNDANELANILSSHWEVSNGGPDWELESIARAELDMRVFQFGKNYLSYIVDR